MREQLESLAAVVMTLLAHIDGEIDYGLNMDFINPVHCELDKSLRLLSETDVSLT